MEIKSIFKDLGTRVVQGLGSAFGTSANTHQQDSSFEQIRTALLDHLRENGGDYNPEKTKNLMDLYIEKGKDALIHSQGNNGFIPDGFSAPIAIRQMVEDICSVIDQDALKQQEHEKQATQLHNLVEGFSSKNPILIDHKRDDSLLTEEHVSGLLANYFDTPESRQTCTMALQDAAEELSFSAAKNQDFFNTKATASDKKNEAMARLFFRINNVLNDPNSKPWLGLDDV